MNAAPKNNHPDEEHSSRSALLAAAKRLFALHGYDGTTVKELADAAGVNVGMISYLFGGKEGLYKKCLSDFGLRNLEAANRILQMPRSQEEVRVRLEMFFEELTNAHLAEPEVTSILHRECGMDFPITQELFRESFLPVFQQLVQFVAHAREHKFTRPDLDPMISTMLHFSSITNALRMDAVAKRLFGFSLEEKTFRELFLKKHLESTLLDLGVPL